MVEKELALAGTNQQLTNFVEHSSVECANLKETIQGTKVGKQIWGFFKLLLKDQLLSTLEFFGEPFKGEEHKFKPERFFTVISQFFDGLQNAINNSR